MALTSKQRKQLRGMANTRETVLIIGKDNVNDGVVAQANEALDALELIKCSVLETSELTAREAADELAAATNSECVQVIGHKFVLYRATTRKDVPRIVVSENGTVTTVGPVNSKKTGRAKAKPRAKKVSVKARAAAKERAAEQYAKAYGDSAPAGRAVRTSRPGATFRKVGGPGSRPQGGRPQGGRSQGQGGTGGNRGRQGR